MCLVSIFSAVLAAGAAVAAPDEVSGIPSIIFHSLVDLQAAINRFVREYNAANPQPFIWKAHPDDIIAARNRGFQTLKSIH